MSAARPRVALGHIQSHRGTARTVGPRMFLKRALDIELSLVGLMLLLPLMAAIALLVRWRHGSPAIFSQLRPGLYERPFQILKFRSMTDDIDEAGRLKPNEMRLTPLGRFLRSTSLDELPELVNVLRGEMSLVGPRPLLMEYLKYYSSEERARHHVKPGITGLAQVSGRNSLSWREKLDRDLEYVAGASLWLDSWILLLTVVRLIKPGRDDVAADGGEAIPEELSAPPWKQGRVQPGRVQSGEARGEYQ